VRRLALLVAALVLAGCGDRGGDGTASLWITRDRGAHVVLTTTVPAGLTAMQALRRVAKIETRYGGRFVRSIDGVSGSLTSQRDWFYFVNGIEADRGAAEYRLHPGDVEWWDFRSWRGRPEFPVVAGAFPEPLLHGYDGKVRPTVVRYRFPEHAALARSLARIVHADSVEPIARAVPDGANAVVLGRGTTLYASNAADPHGPVTFEIGAETARRLVVDPAAYRFRFDMP
jgi:hypothetical protein